MTTPTEIMLAAQDALHALVSPQEAEQLLKIGAEAKSPQTMAEYFVHVIGDLRHRALYFEPPVGPEEFLFGERYLALKRRTVYPKVLECFCEMNNGEYSEAVLTGAIGCWPGEAEALTPTGWVRMDEYAGQPIAEYDPSNGVVSFRQAEFVDRPSDGWWTFARPGFEKKVSPEHTVLLHGMSGAQRVVKAHELGTGIVNRDSYAIPSTFTIDRPGVALNDDELRLMVAVLADGNFPPGYAQDNHTCRITLRRPRKRQRLEDLLTRLGLAWHINGPYTGRPTEVTYVLTAPLKAKAWDWAWECNEHQLRVLFDEIPYWDGLHPNSTSTGEWRFHTSDVQARDFVQYLCQATGHRARLRCVKGVAGRRDHWCVQARLSDGQSYKLRGTTATWSEPTLGERKYCFVTESGYFVARYRGNVVVSGNTAKTTLAIWTTAYQLYRLLLYRNPHLEFALDPSSEILFIFQSIRAQLSKSVDFERFRDAIIRSPFFNEPRHQYRRDLTSELQFPRRIGVRPVSGEQTAALGQNVFGGVLDEVNFMAVIEKSRHSVEDMGIYDQAVELYNAINFRRTSRFMKLGKLPGMLCIVSSKRYPGQFTDKKIEESRKQIAETGKTTIYVYDKRTWEIKPEGTFSDERFNVFIGNEFRKPYIMEEGEVSEFPELVVSVPVDLRQRVEADLIKALRDILGVSTLARFPFMLNTDAVAKSFGKVPSVISMDEVDLKTTSPVILPKLFKAPEFPRFCHVDLGLTGDAAGVAIGHVPKFVRVGRTDNETEPFPIIRFDCLLRVYPPRNDEIQFHRIRALIYKLRDLGLNIQWVTYDSFQSVDSVQILRQKMFGTGIVSMDKTPLPYEIAKTAFYDGRVEAPANKRAVRELISLERDPVKGKIDHPVHGCFTGDTRIALLDGSLPTFEELRDRYPVDPFPVYSMFSTGVCVGWARNPRITRKHAELVEVILDNYTVIRCTPDHLFMTLDQEWVQAQNLTPDMRLMPLYRSQSAKGGWLDYEHVWCPVRKSRILTHHLALGLAGQMPRGHVIHHLDHNKRNNDPRNLVVEGREDHARYHTTLRYETDEFYVTRLRAGHRLYRESGGNERSRQNIMRLFAEGKLRRGRDVCSVEGCFNLADAKSLCGAHYQKMRRERQRQARTGTQSNHRILSVRPLPYREDVWDLTVDGTENFALANGVFVHNSKDLADAIAGVIYGLTMKRQTWVDHGIDLREIPDSLREQMAKAEAQTKLSTAEKLNQAAMAVE